MQQPPQHAGFPINTSAGRETENNPTFPMCDLCKIMPLTGPEMGLFTELDTINNLFERAVGEVTVGSNVGVSVVFMLL